MFYNILLDNVPETTPNGFKIDTDFRTSIKFELLMQNNEVSQRDKIQLALNLYYYDLSEIDDINKAVEDMLWFYQCGKIKKKELANSNNTKSKKGQIYSYEFDDDYIYSAFLEQYNIDLNDVDLHWWKFKAMFTGLKEDTQIVKIMGYRGMDLSKIKDTETKKHYKRLKKAYALPDMRSEEEKERDFGVGFW